MVCPGKIAGNPSGIPLVPQDARGAVGFHPCGAFGERPFRLLAKNNFLLEEQFSHLQKQIDRSEYTPTIGKAPQYFGIESIWSDY